MAGPFVLGPNEVQGGIPTNALLATTTVRVNAGAAGNFEMTAGGSPTESTSINAGVTNFTRRFGGVFLAVRNGTNANMTVTTA